MKTQLELWMPLRRQCPRQPRWPLSGTSPHVTRAMDTLREDLLPFHSSRGVERRDWGEDPKTRCIYLTEQMQSDLEEELGRACWESSSLLFALDFVLLFIIFSFFMSKPSLVTEKERKLPFCLHQQYLVKITQLRKLALCYPRYRCYLFSSKPQLCWVFV